MQLSSTHDAGGSGAPRRRRGRGGGGGSGGSGGESGGGARLVVNELEVMLLHLAESKCAA